MEAGQLLWYISMWTHADSIAAFRDSSKVVIFFCVTNFFLDADDIV